MWARLDGCILDKIPWASVSGASWAGRGGQSCCIQLRILDITVLVAWVLETREARCVWGVRQPKQIDIYESVSENQIDTVRKSGRDGWGKKNKKQVPEDLMGGFGWASGGCSRAGGHCSLSNVTNMETSCKEKNGQRGNMGEENERSEVKEEDLVTCLRQWHLCSFGYADGENSAFVVHFGFNWIILFAFSRLKSKKPFFPPLPIEDSNDVPKLTVLDAERHNITATSL